MLVFLDTRMGRFGKIRVVQPDILGKSDFSSMDGFTLPISVLKVISFCVVDNYIFLSIFILNKLI